MLRLVRFFDCLSLSVSSRYASAEKPRNDDVNIDHQRRRHQRTHFPQVLVSQARPPYGSGSGLRDYSGTWLAGVTTNSVCIDANLLETMSDWVPSW